MLEPETRAALTEQLRPPAGFHLVQAVATTFTLDLTSALAIPLSFASHQVRQRQNPLAVLEAVRRASDRIDIFAQAGQIAVPASASDLVAFLEPMVHGVTAPNAGGLFHPKVWVLEYGRGEERQHRMLCASRNLTADRSWDIVVRLDGSLSGDAGHSGEAVAHFVSALPAMCVVPMDARRINRVHAFAERLTTVRWEAPADFNAVTFHPFGIPGVARPRLDELFDGKRHLVISPFLSDDGIASVVPSRSREIHVLSRRESLDQLKPATLRRLKTYVLDDAVTDDDLSDAERPGVLSESFVGLHAKAYALDRRDGSHLIVGSANATEAAFARNVEMLIDLRGPDTKIGVHALFGEEAPLRRLALEIDTAGGVEPSVDDVADRALERAVRRLAANRLRAVVVPGRDVYSVRVESVYDVTPDPAFRYRMRPITLPGKSYDVPVPGHPQVMMGLELTEITPFFVLTVIDERDQEKSTVVAAELVGDIPGRRDAIIARQITDRAAFLELLSLLLALSGEGADAGATFGGGYGAWDSDGAGLFETLVRAVGAGHDGLDDVKRIVDRIAAAQEDDDSVLPDGFEELWDAAWEAHRVVSRRRAPRRKAAR